jgi:hypothetical protein
MRALIALLCALVLSACRHPLEIQGQGDIVERIQGLRGCTYEEFQAGSLKCSDNAATDTGYTVSYEGVPHPGWVFGGWDGTGCSTITPERYCEYDVGGIWTAFINLTWPTLAFPATRAVFLTEQEQSLNQQLADTVLGDTCLTCHVEGGVSEHTRLVLDNSGSISQELTNFVAFRDFINEVEGGGALILSKVRGGDGHGGGVQLPSGSDEYSLMRDFLMALDESLEGEDLDIGSFWDGVSLTDPGQTLRRAALILAGRLPSAEEVAALAESGEAGLRQAVRGLLQGEYFHEFLTSGANDRLLTEGLIYFLEFQALVQGYNFYPVIDDRAFAAHLSGSEADLENWLDWHRRLLYGAARAPLELIAHVVENERPYTEILTADYTMVNPQMAEVLNSDVAHAIDDASAVVPAQNRGQIFPDEQFVSECTFDAGCRVLNHSGFFENYPHAGVLNTLAFLNRYPSTETNRNRARARWTYLHFLGVDIEKSAARTTDPLALVDRDNPTLKNPACVVCHQLHDPVAGTFQNYGNAGWYRDAWGGIDSLPDTYKYPQEYDADAEPSAYVHGDTWYRDMRTPGVDGRAAPDPGNSLQWLAQQIVSDPRFAVATVKFWWPALMGVQVLQAPASAADRGAFAYQRAFEVQTAAIEVLAEGFRIGFDGGAPYNLKDLLQEMVMTRWFRAGSVGAARQVQSEIELRGIGSRRLLTPRELNNKTRAVLGFAWNELDDWEGTPDRRYAELTHTYGIYYGGIDSAGVIARARQLTALMMNVAERQALELACGATLVDFNRAEGDKLLFPGIDRDTSPLTEVAATFTVSPTTAAASRSYRVSGALRRGSHRLHVELKNDYADPESEADGGLIITRISVLDDQGNVVKQVEAAELRAVPGFMETDIDGWRPGSEYWNEVSGEYEGWFFWTKGEVSIPIDVPGDDNYRIEVEAWQQAVGSDAAVMRISVNGEKPRSNTAGEQAIRAALVVLHRRFHGDQLTADDAEITASYQLLVDTWEQRRRSSVDQVVDWPRETCGFPHEQFIWLNSRGRDHSHDPARMIGSWASVLIYLMTDFHYLHE